MSTDSDDGDGHTLAPDDAFSLLGNETRVQILEALAEAEDDHLSFSALHDRVDMRDSGQFNYHLDKLLGHFVEQRGEGYALRRAGERVVEAILSGAVTDDPFIERTRIDDPCHLCGAPREVSFREERVATWCTSCSGMYPGDRIEVAESVPDDYGFLGYLDLPPAGVKDRTPGDVHRAARVWNISERLPAAAGVCPHCSAPVETSLNICENHDAGATRCPECGYRKALGSYMSCTNCTFSQGGVVSLAFLAHDELLDFLTDHGINPIAPASARFNAVIMDYEEAIHSRDPLEASFTFAADGDTLTLSLDDLGEVTEVVPRRDFREE